MGNSTIKKPGSGVGKIWFDNMGSAIGIWDPFTRNPESRDLRLPTPDGWKVEGWLANLGTDSDVFTA